MVVTPQTLHQHAEFTRFKDDVVAAMRVSEPVFNKADPFRARPAPGSMAADGVFISRLLDVVATNHARKQSKKNVLSLIHI